MMRFFTKRFLLPVVFLLSLTIPSFASHIIGSDITVQYVSPNNYLVTVTFFRDCLNGIADFPGLGGEPPMYVGVYNKADDSQQQIITMDGPTVTTLIKGDACYQPGLCVAKGVYTKNIVIPASVGGQGYYLSWMRCCRNNAILNIVNPGGEGSVFYAEIPDPSYVNSTPVFKTVPQATQSYMCAGYTNYVDFGATDADGDVLVYSLSAPISYTSGIINPNQTGFDNLPASGYSTITWGLGFSTSDPFGAGTTTLGAASGLLTVTPPALGLGVYVIGVKVEEWRGATKLGEIHRDFQFEVLNCQRLNIAANPAVSTVCVGQVSTLTGTGALALWTYSWAPGGQTGPTITDIATTSGIQSYTCTASNGIACIMNTYAVSASQPTPGVTTTGSVCAGQNTTLTASGGTTYSWSNGTTGAVLTGVANASYTVTAADAAGCTATASGTVYQAPVLTSTVSVTNVACSGSPATATVTASNGSPGYTYLWSSGGQTTTSATGLGTGNYSVTVTDTKGCTSVKTGSVTITTAPTLTFSSTSGGCVVANGTATANPSGGSPYTYLWENGQTTQTATGLAGGNYSVTVTNSQSCTKTGTVTVATTGIPAISTTSTTIAGCSVSNGTATANATGGTGSYTYSWLPSGQNSQTATGLSGGDYTVTVSDVNGCSVATTVSVSVTSVPTVTVTSNQSTCGFSNGSATANPAGGTPGYTYLWDNGQTTQTATGLTSGLYTVTITDLSGCTTTDLANISNANGPAATTAVNGNVLCFGGNTGSATATPSNGTPGFTYLWTNGETTQTATGLIVGNHNVTVTDANGCLVVASISISEPPVLISSSAQTPILCNGGTSNATITSGGGTPGYTYNWNSGQTTSAITGIAAGNYSVTVTDANGCTSANTLSITQPATLTSSTTQSTILCNGGTGTASVTSAGGTQAYTYSWNNGQTTSALAGISAGIYSVTITDANGCTTQSSLTITQPTPLLLSVTGNDSVCAGDTALLSAASSGGTPAYTYVWTPGPQNGQSISVSPSASTNYFVTTTDANGCTSTSQAFNVSILPTPNAFFDTLSNGMYGATYAFNDLSTGGTSWFWYFGDGGTSALQNPIHTFPGSGTYTVTQIAFNQFGCPDTFKIVLNYSDGILIPNVFTPDGDGVNDVWYIPNSGMSEFHVDIYDRWGLKVFETTADEIRWDGHSTAGNLLTDGTYYYVLKAVLKSFNGDRDYSTKGHITLLTQKRK